MSEQTNDITLINPSGREVIVPNELAQDLLLQPGYRVKPADEPKEAKPEASQPAETPETATDESKETPKPRSRTSK